MKLRNKQIAIVGAGPGGLTLARLLQLQGATVKVYERDQHKYARVQGSPLDLHDESGLAALRKANLIDAFRANGKGQNLLLGQKADGEIGFYASFKVDEHWSGGNGLDYSDRNQLLAWFDNAYKDWSPAWRELFEGTSLPLTPRPIYCTSFDQTWETSPNLTLLGDAAHVMPPFAGEGVNMAMLDALELSEHLASSAYSTILDAIKAYEAGMFDRAATASRESLENGNKMHADDSLAWMLKFFNEH